MNSSWINIFLRFVILVLLQVLVFNSLVLHGMVTPFIYIWLILMLPINTPLWSLLIVSFILGISVDIFSNTYGIHAFASVFLAYIRPNITRILTPKDGYELDARPSINEQGISWFAAYLSIAVFIHHTVYFLVEIMSIANFKYLLLKIVLSSAMTIILLFLFHVFSQSASRKKAAR